MAKQFTVITANQKIMAVVGQKTTLVNASPNNVFLVDDATNTALNPTDQEAPQLPYEAKQAVLNALYSLAPGASKSLAAGTYALSFDYSPSQSVVLITE